VVCDIESEQSLLRAFATTRLVLNCAGPYRFLGLQVARAAVAARTDVMDISGEPQYMDEVFLRLHREAEEAGVLVLSACAFDSVPGETHVNALTCVMVACLACSRSGPPLHDAPIRLSYTL
jgi:short subunit dehydrogenase-like uncharacterized protein